MNTSDSNKFVNGRWHYIFSAMEEKKGKGGQPNNSVLFNMLLSWTLFHKYPR